jgi:hypothetical protein
MEMKILEELELLLQNNDELRVIIHNQKEVNKFLKSFIERNYSEPLESPTATDMIKMHDTCRKYDGDVPNYKEIYKFYMHILALDYIKHRGPQ